MEISKTRESIHFCSFLQEISSFYKCFSVLNWDSQFQNFIEEFQCLQCMSNIGLLITFTQLQAAPSVGHLLKQSLVLEISILRDPSFWKFPFWGIPRFRNFHFEGSLISGILGQAWNKQAFPEVQLSFSLRFFHLDSLHVHDTDILKRHGSWLAFSGCKDHWYKVPPLHRGHHRQLNK